MTDENKEDDGVFRANRDEEKRKEVFSLVED